VTKEFLARDWQRALSGKIAADCHWGPCYNCGVPAATGFACQAGEQGPRRMLLSPRTTADGEIGGEAGPIGANDGRWRYIGPPGDPRRLAPDEAAGPTASAATVTSVRQALGSEMESKDAGLSVRPVPPGLASPVVAAGDESTG
jgi:hypothetical protein